MKLPSLYQAFTFFIAAQFLNVQIQTAYGTEAVNQANPEVVQALKAMETKIQTRMQGMSEHAQLRYAYKLYKTDVKLRNRTFLKTDQEIQERIDQLNQGKVSGQTNSQNPEDQKMAQEISSDQSLQDLAGIKNIKVSFHHSQVKKEQLLKNTDPLLLDLGSEINDDGSFTRANFSTFQSKVFEMNQAQETRGPASLNIVVKIILALLLVTAGLAVLYFVLVIFALATAFGSGITPMGYAVLIFLTVGSITGMVFGLKALFSLQERFSHEKALAFA